MLIELCKGTVVSYESAEVNNKNHDEIKIRISVVKQNIQSSNFCKGTKNYSYKNKKAEEIIKFEEDHKTAEEKVKSIKEKSIGKFKIQYLYTF